VREVEPYAYEIAQTRDTLVIEIDIGDAPYASANSQRRGAFRFSPTSEEYRRLTATVEAAGREAVKRGWRTIDVLAEFRVVRIALDNRVRDAMNLGQAEANALTRSGVWMDDCVAAPVVLDLQCDAAGPNRVRLEIVRVHERNGIKRTARPPQMKRARGGRRRVSTGDATDGRVAYIDGKPVPMAEALAELRK
jgi:hypothetical protein